MTPMFTLFPRRWSHWLLFLFGPMFVATYFGLLSWEPVEEAITQFTMQPPGLARGEGLLGLVSLLLLTPLVGVVALFLLLFVWVVLAGILGPFGRMLGLPDWAFFLLVASVSAGLVYANSGAWLPWSLQAFERIASAYLILLL
ncbi:MAG: hypothetical protein A3J45_14880 [Candidatus Rokubacteria bacterium RIFCSPHIGHO2_02_FULL_69_13]|nr:MAG: hypothetical protein A3J45_14880 [Candidatus Rokubacteria bacterium RIFCSPHIGHO2_02_FULL_69_13]